MKKGLVIELLYNETGVIFEKVHKIKYLSRRKLADFIWYRDQYEQTELVGRKKHIAAFYNKETKTAFYI